jgi:digeranylgeranylglycerophospholipid reductase
MKNGVYDLAVIGGSFAGLACATAAASRGLRTLVIDQKTDPASDCRTTGILVKEAADQWDVPRALTRKIHSVRLYAPSLRHLDLQRQGYYFLATDTPALLRWLAMRAAAAGADLHFGVTCRRIIRRSQYFVLPDLDVGASYLIGADGPRSTVARTFGLGVNRDFLTGVECHYHHLRGVDVDYLHILIDSQLAPGYIGWIVPGVDAAFQVGLAARQPHAPHMDQLLDRLARRFDFTHARVHERRAGVIPIGGPVRPFAADRVMLIGDAAGFVSPLTAGGIHTALHWGRLAGVAVANHLLDQGPLPHHVLHASFPHHWNKRWLRRLFNLRPPNRLIDALWSNSMVCAAAQAVFFHQRGLRSAAAWRDLARVLWDAA